eukprot:scaffold268968_cov70-Cyclotella_meneghiniana.AAC.2
MGFKLEHFLEQPWLQLIILRYNQKCFPMYNPKSNLERAEMDYHDIIVADITASTATAIGFAATDDGVLRSMEVFLPSFLCSDFENSVKVSTW